MQLRKSVYSGFLVLVSLGILGSSVLGDWPERDKLTASDGATLDDFGASVGMAGNKVLVGSLGDDDKGSWSGSAYLFERSGQSWTQKQKLLAFDGAADDFFGQSVSISGDTLVIGAYGDDDNGSNSGSAYIFKFDGLNWNQQDKITTPAFGSDVFFGYTVSIDGSTIAVGTYGDAQKGFRAGAVYVFKPNAIDPNNWDQVAKLTASNGQAGDNFGFSTVISGDYIIVGTPADDDNGGNSGSAYIFKFDGQNWNEQTQLLAADGVAFDQFGFSVSISGTTAIVGAFLDDDKGNDSGSAYIFEPNAIDPNNWDQVAKLTAGDGAAGDNLGIAVSINGDIALVGASRSGNNGVESGSAYLFERSGQNWGQAAKLIASDAKAGDNFGSSVFVTPGFAAVGAIFDDADSTAAGADFGSAYMFINCPAADLNKDCFVDLTDFATMTDQWLTGLLN